jgi:hypothetical protein
MKSVQELVNNYQKYSDKELIDIYQNTDQYSDEANEALRIVLSNLGGIDKLRDRLNKQLEIDNEIWRIKTEIKELIKQGCEPKQIKDKIKINLISINQLDNLIEEISFQLESEKADLKIKPRTVIGSIIGGVIGGTIGGIFWGITMMYSRHIFLIFIMGIAGLSYGTIKLFTKQSKKNWLVLCFTVLSVIYALILAESIFEIFGFQGT